MDSVPKYLLLCRKPPKMMGNLLNHFGICVEANGGETCLYMFCLVIGSYQGLDTDEFSKVDSYAEQFGQSLAASCSPFTSSVWKLSRLINLTGGRYVPQGTIRFKGACSGCLTNKQSNTGSCNSQNGLQSSLTLRWSFVTTVKRPQSQKRKWPC